jgi:NTE family protein
MASQAAPGSAGDPPPLPAFAIFEGGGAKGIAHIGALEAVRRVGIELQGVAGASAGAIAAVLAAIGMEPRRIFNPDVGGGDIFSARGSSPTDLIGARDWAWFLRIRRVAPLLLFLAAVSAMVIGVLLWLVWQATRLFGRSPPPLRLFRHFGLFDSTGARDFIDGVIHDMLRPAYAAKGATLDRPVRFRHLDPGIDKSLLPLRIIATDVEDRKLKMFGPETPDVVIADAVVASFSIPLVFRPAAVRGDGSERPRYVDGGLVANLPTWVFNEDKLKLERGRANRPPLPVVAFSLADEAAGPMRSLFGFLAGVLRTGIFGSQFEARRLTPNLFPVSLPANIPVLGFDCDRATAVRAWTDGYEEALRVLQRDLRNAPDAARARLKQIRDEATARSLALRQRDGHAPLPNLRVGIVMPFGNVSFRVRVTAGMDDDADDRLLLDARGAGAPAAFAARDICYVDRPMLATGRLFMTKYERALVRPGIASILAIPIFDRPGQLELDTLARVEPIGVLCLDSDGLLETEYDDMEFLLWLAEMTETLDDIVKGLRKRDTD